MLASALIYGVFLPAALAAAVLLSSLRQREGGDRRAASASALPAAVGLGFVAGYAGISGVPKFPPVVTGEWLPFIAFGATAFALGFAFWKPPAWVQLLKSFLVLAAVQWLMLRPLMEHTWEGAAGWLWLAGTSLAGLAYVEASERIAAKTADHSLLAVAGASGALTAGALGLSGSALLAQLMGVQAAACGILYLATLKKPELDARFMALPAGAILLALVANGHFYSELSLAGAALVMAAPLLPLIAAWKLPESVSGWKRSLLLGTLGAVTPAVAALMAVQTPPDVYY